jgi:hypothetical protein
MTDAPDLDYHALCIDTNIFRETGYALDRGLPAQLGQFAQSPVQVVISEIVHREMKRHLAELIGKARAALEKGLKEVQQEMLASEVAASRARKAIITSETDQEIAERRLEQFYEGCGAIVLPADTVSSREVLERYFSQHPPFAAAGDKKQEFPDAFALMSVEKWAEEQNFKVLVVSHDKGWGEFCAKSERLVYGRDLGSALKFFQPHNAAGQFMMDFNACLVATADEHGILHIIAERIKESVEDMEIDVEAESRFYWVPTEAFAKYLSHAFRHLSAEQVDIDLVRVTEREVVVRLTATINCNVYASFSLSMTDPIDKDEVSLGTQNAELAQSFDSDVLVTFEGDFSMGLAGVSVENVEIVDALPTVDFGEIEMVQDERDEADYPQYPEDPSMVSRGNAEPS